MKTPTPPQVDVHTHIFCWGENPAEGYFSRRTQDAWLTRVIKRLTGIEKERGNTLSEKMRNRLLRHLAGSSLDKIVVLAQDAVYRTDGTRDDAATPFYVANDYVLELARQHAKILPGCSINPIRHDAVAELERCFAAGCRLIKIHTAIQGVDPDRPAFDPFYRRAAELKIVLMFHTGYEHSCKIISQQFTDPRRLARPLEHGGIVIAAHCGTCAFFDPEDYYPRFVDMLRRYDNLYGDTAVMASLIRWTSLHRLACEADAIRCRILHGSDYPLPPSRVPYLRRVGLFPAERYNPLDLDLRIKKSFHFGPQYGSKVLSFLSPD